MGPDRRLRAIKTICIIGGGPAGVAAAKYSRAEKCFSKIEVIEQRSTTGGVWNWEPKNDELEHVEVPSVTPDVPLDKPVWRGEGRRRATYQSAMYERLEANLPKMLMQHSDMDFAPETQLFPTHGDILEYLQRYADDVRDCITLEAQVVEVSLAQPDLPTWTVVIEALRTGKRTTHQYDAVVVASGHYQIPFIPQYEGLKNFNKREPGIVTHSKYYNSPEDFRGKTVLLIGYGPSGSDIASQIASTCKSPIHISTRSGPPPLLPRHSIHHPAVTCFSAASRSVDFEDCTSLSDIDAIVFCTGYLYSYPFLSASLRSVLDPSLPSHGGHDNKGARLHGTYQQIFYTPHPTLTFLTLPWNIVPFPVAEAQSAAIARVYAGRLALPSEEDCWVWEHAREHEEGVGNGKGFHRLPTPGDVEYVNLLARWCHKASGEDDETSPNGCLGKAVGKKPPFWDQRLRWLRLNVPDIKKAFAERGDGRHVVKTIEELGFAFPSLDDDGKQ